MYTNVNLAAPVGVLLFLGAGFLLFALALVLLWSLIAKRFGLTKLFLVAAVLVAGLYLGTMLIFSLTSKEQVLARGQEKHFCEIDCHLAYSVSDVQQPKILGDGPNLPTAAGLFRVVTIKTRFDEGTISSNRGNGQLYPSSRVLVVIDKNGKEYFPSPEGQKALEATHTAGTPLTSPLTPGESYATSIVFDLPSDIQDPTLLIHEGETVTHFVIGHENSPFHKRTRFQI